MVIKGSRLCDICTVVSGKKVFHNPKDSKEWLKKIKEIEKMEKRGLIKYGVRHSIGTHLIEAGWELREVQLKRGRNKA